MSGFEMHIAMKGEVLDCFQWVWMIKSDDFWNEVEYARSTHWRRERKREREDHDWDEIKRIEEEMKGWEL